MYATDSAVGLATVACVGALAHVVSERPGARQYLVVEGFAPMPGDGHRVSIDVTGEATHHLM
jgi:hypothetical protein